MNALPALAAVAPLPGKKRSPGINILLYIVTIGVYWFVWLAKAFGEVAKDRGEELKRGVFIGMIVVWVAAIGLSSTNAVSNMMEDRNQPTPADPLKSFERTVAQMYEPLALAASGLTIVFYALQFVYATHAHGVVAQSVSGYGILAPPKSLAATFNIIAMVGAIPIPFVNSLIALAAAIVGLVWAVKVQGAMNQYWDMRAAGAPQGMAPPPAPYFAPGAPSSKP